MSANEFAQRLLGAVVIRVRALEVGRADPELAGKLHDGEPCIKGTRIPAALVLGYLAALRDTTVILREFPDLKAEDVAACLDYARELAEFNEVAA